MTELISEPVSLVASMAEVLDSLEETAINYPPADRWPLLRLGQRKYISRYVRRAVFQRDGGRCLSCGDQLELQEARLDHIVPWSAWGPDTSDNLRVLCDPCNTDRSNFRTDLDTWNARRTPIALCCTGCAHLDRNGNEIHEPFPVTPEMVTAFCAQCGLVSRTWTEEVW